MSDEKMPIKKPQLKKKKKIKISKEEMAMIEAACKEAVKDSYWCPLRGFYKEMPPHIAKMFPHIDQIKQAKKRAAWELARKAALTGLEKEKP